MAPRRADCAPPRPVGHRDGGRPRPAGCAHRTRSARGTARIPGRRGRRGRPRANGQQPRVREGAIQREPARAASALRDRASAGVGCGRRRPWNDPGLRPTSRGGRPPGRSRSVAQRLRRRLTGQRRRAPCCTALRPGPGPWRGREQAGHARPTGCASPTRSGRRLHPNRRTSHTHTMTCPYRWIHGDHAGKRRPAGPRRLTSRSAATTRRPIRPGTPEGERRGARACPATGSRPGCWAPPPTSRPAGTPGAAARSRSTCHPRRAGRSS